MTRSGWNTPSRPTGLPDAELAVVPGTSHGLLVEKPGLCNLLITEFLTKEPVPTFAPIRRAAPETR
jgi:pimeloyl-ACP methyl ester carboxylesterase